MRILILLHRYLGIGVGIVIAMWCLSGLVMMYVSYPSLDNAQRLRSLQPIDWKDCCAFDAVQSTVGDQSIDRFDIEMTSGRPILRIAQPAGVRRNIELRSGEAIEQFTQQDSELTARRYLTTHNESGQLRYREIDKPDQWTIGSALGRQAHLQIVSLGDPKDTELYISPASGKVVLNTNASERLFNWLGAVPHWLYPITLRQNVKLWSQVVIWLSLLGTFLTVIGLYIGISQWLVSRRRHRWSHQRGVHLWHHLGGLIFGLFTLTWVLSGLLSMNPWGLLESSGSTGEQARLSSLALNGTHLPGVLQAIVNGAQNSNDIVRLESAPLDGKLYLLKYTMSAQVPQRVDALTLKAAPLTRAEIEQAAMQLDPDSAVQKIDFLPQGDNYVFANNISPSQAIYRVVLNDAERTRYYLDAISASIVSKYDRNARGYRWWFEALHRWDFGAALRSHPLWDVVMLTLLLGATTVSLTGVYMGYRFLRPKRLRV